MPPARKPSSTTAQASNVRGIMCGMGTVDARGDQHPHPRRRDVGADHARSRPARERRLPRRDQPRTIPEFSADLLLVDTSFGGDVVLDEPLFRALPAAQASQVIEFDSNALTDTHYPGVIAIAEFLIDQIGALDLRTDLV